MAEELVDLATDPDVPAQPAPGTPIPEIAGPRAENLAEAAKLLGARRGIKVVGVDNPDLPDAETAAGGGFLPGPHAKLAGPPSRSGSPPNPETDGANQVSTASQGAGR
ncbi:hypothetical protein AB0F43_21360 [Kribbella sp. NPDC023972]|uniref:hypothetical protein n=1 Tax=Kribbella sp. NPDC023972 TaxID=3154795 RepID=UPI0033E619A9